MIYGTVWCLDLSTGVQLFSQVPSERLTICMNLDKLYNFSELQFHLLKVKIIITLIIIH